MKKFLAFALMSSLLMFAACKKSEQQQQAQPSSPAPANPDKAFKPQQPKEEPQGTLKVDLYTENNLVKSITPSDLPSMTSTKIKAGSKEVLAIPLKDILAKSNVKGKSVALVGQQRTATLTWEQANAGDIYLILTKKQRLRLYSNSKNLGNIKLPKRLEKITVSAGTQAAGSTPAK